MADEIIKEVVAEEAKVEEQPKVENQEASKANENDKKPKKEKKPRRPFKLVMKTWSKGLSKEAGRVSWEKKHDVLRDFVTIIIICAILALIFFGIDMIIISVRR